MKKTSYTYRDIERMCLKIIRQMNHDNWQPDYVVGITRGGLLPATLISQWYGCDMHTLKVSLRNGNADNCESNCWMAEHAFGCDLDGNADPYFRKRILIVDDINDTGATLNWIQQDWQGLCRPNDTAWPAIWNKNVRVACLFSKAWSQNKLEVNYAAEEITEDNDPGWVVFPWEQWSEQ